MSLINDALKKAQRMRTEGTNPPTDENSAPASGNEPLQRVVRREKPAGFRSQVLALVGAAAAVILLAGGAFYFLRSPDATPTAPTATAAAPAPTTTPAPSPAASPAPNAPTPEPKPTPAPVVATTAPTTPASIPSPTPAPVVTEPAGSPAPVPAQAIATTPPTAPASEPVAAAPAVTAPMAPTPVAPKPSSRMIGVIEHFKVGGIRAAGAESKVLMNDKVFRINDVVDHELEIRIVRIEQKALTFEDARGATYTRTF